MTRYVEIAIVQDLINSLLEVLGHRLTGDPSELATAVIESAKVSRDLVGVLESALRVIEGVPDQHELVARIEEILSSLK